MGFRRGIIGRSFLSDWYTANIAPLPCQNDSHAGHESQRQGAGHRANVASSSPAGKYRNIAHE